MMMKKINYIVYIIKSIFKIFFFKPIYWFYPNQVEKKIWLIGSGRSGTTWIASLINFDNSYRELFEPFHPKFLRLFFLKFKKHLYLRKKSSNYILDKVINQVFNGKYYDTRVDSENEYIWKKQYPNILVKDIFANLFAYNVCSKNKKIKPILLIRNPFAVALSKQQRKGWDWMADPIEFLEQKKLYSDFLKPHISLIKKVSAEGTYIDKQILIWSIINYIPLMQFDQSQLCVTFYENWITDPDEEFKKVQNFINNNSKSSVDIGDTDKFANPSRTSGKKKFNISGWAKNLSLDQVKSGESILDCFGFKDLYNSESIPNYNSLEKIYSIKQK